MVARECYLEVAPSSTTTAAPTTQTTDPIKEYVQLSSWNFRATHGESVSAYGEGEQYDFSRGGILFNFTCWASDLMIDDLVDRYNIGTADGSVLTTYKWRLRYYTPMNGATARFLTFLGKVRDLDVDRPVNSESRVTVRGVVRLCDANGVSTGAFPKTATGRE